MYSIFNLPFLADFQFQTDRLSRLKDSNLKYLTKHIFIHAILLVLPLTIGFLNNVFLKTLLSITIILVTHTVFDFIKGKVSTKYIFNEVCLFLIDQLLHISIIIFVCMFFGLTTINEPTVFLLTKLHLKWLLLIIILTKPANVLFKVAFKKYTLDQTSDNTQSGAGALIGSMERLISSIFIAQNQFGAIGLIYTAKSIARYKQIEEDKRFAEYYLLGNLYSILFGLIAYFTIFNS